MASRFPLTLKSSLVAIAIVSGILSLPLLLSFSTIHQARDAGFSPDPYSPFDSLRTDVNDYSWPTNPELWATSSFADFRDLHFHAGIDITTHRRKGYNVYASRDGYVSRIEVSPFGYGKLLWVRHRDGYTTCYAHLERFNDFIEPYVDDLQSRQGRYSVRVYPAPGQFPVRKGQTIAYTGDTGVGDAHLHFEIRDEFLNPVDPLLFPAIFRLVQDRLQPRFHQIEILPLSYGSAVQGDARPLRSGVTRLQEGEYVVPKVLHIQGDVGIGVKASDRYGPFSLNNRVNEFAVYLDSTRIFHSKKQRFPQRESRQIALVYDWPSYRSGYGFFENLFVEPGNRLPFYDREQEGAGVIHADQWPEGFHELVITASDIHGNLARLRATMVLSRLQHRDPDAFNLSPLPPPKIAEPIWLQRPASRNLGGAQDVWSVAETLVPAVRNASRSFGESDLPEFNTDVTENDELKRSSIVYVAQTPEPSSRTSLSSEVMLIRDCVVVTLSSHLPFTLRPSLWVSSRLRRFHQDLNALDAHRYQGTFPLDPRENGPIHIVASADVNGSRHVQACDEFCVYPITPFDGGTVISPNGIFAVSFPPRTVFQTLYCRLDQNENGVTVLPDDVLLEHDARVDCKLREEQFTTKIGLFQSVGSEWKMLDWTPARGKAVLSGRITHFLGEFCVLPDTTPPEISRVRISARNGRLSIVFRLRDNRSGISPDHIRVIVDGSLLICEYDPYNHTVEYSGRDPFPPGPHLLEIEAGDRMENVAAFKRSFVSPEHSALISSRNFR